MRRPALAAAEVRDAAQRGVDWLLRQQLTDGPMSGLLTGGWGTISGGAVHPDERLPWASTEHNLDAWQALSLAATVLDCTRCATAADTLRQAILAVLWDPAKNGFSQGMRPEGRDTVEPLDVNSWGSIFLTAANRPDLAAISLSRTHGIRRGGPGRRRLPGLRAATFGAEPGELGLVRGIIRGGPRAGPARRRRRVCGDDVGAGVGAARPTGRCRWPPQRTRVGSSPPRPRWPPPPGSSSRPTRITRIRCGRRRPAHGS